MSPCWPDSTVVCLGSGPSLTTDDIDTLPADAHLIAVNDAIRLVPHADVLFSSDIGWWRKYPGMRRPGPPRKIVLGISLRAQYVEPYICTGVSGLEMVNPQGLRSGGHSGYAAVNLAAQLGATRIVLLGYDMQPSSAGQHHFFAQRAGAPHLAYSNRLRMWPLLHQELQQHGITLINASRRTALTCIPCLPLEAAFGS